MAAVLSEFLADATRRRWRWGETDCMLTVCDWIAVARGFDPAAPFRGRYSDEAGCRALLASAGGLLRLVRETFTSAGLKVTASPSAGDVAVVRAPVVRGERIVTRHTGAICVGYGGVAVMRPDRGLVIARDFPVVCAWSI